MCAKLHIKKGDTVKVLAGDSRGMSGKVLKVEVSKLRAIVEGVNIISKHTKPNAKMPQGGIAKIEAPINLSNLMVVEKGVATRIGRRINSEGKLVRYSKKSGEEIK
jgi:large subunit ribosomal protein L24